MEDEMKRIMIFYVALVILPLLITSANAQQGLVETVANGCKMEIEDYRFPTDILIYLSRLMARLIPV